MSTPCSIIVPEGNKYKWIYVHWDGTPDWAGVRLYMHYNTEEKVQQLIALGGLSVLDEEIGVQIDFDSSAYDGHGNQCVAYHRDRGDDLEINEANSLKEAAAYGYAYLWQDGKWYYCYNGRKSDLFANKDFLRGLKREGVKFTNNMLPKSTTKATAVAIKFENGTYYAGCNKSNAQTILGAQLYKSKKTAQNVIDKSVNFPLHAGQSCTLVEVELKEK